MIDLYLKEFEKLNSYQREAVTSDERFLLLNAVVGSGKTTVLTHKILHLHMVKKVSLKDMIVLTFTNKAAKEIMDRVSAFDENLKKEMKYFGTFHSVAKTILKESEDLDGLGYNKDFEVIDNEESAEMMNKLIEDKNLKIKYKSRLMKRVEEYKKGKTLFGVMKTDDDIQKLHRLYYEEKIKKNLMDFDDLMERCIEILDTPLNPKWIIIDEFQDTDSRQLEMIKKLTGSDTHLFAIGDPNQIIYSWRTGKSNIFEEYKNLFKPKEITLPINYRSSKTILEAAKSIIRNQELEGAKEQGSPIIIKRNYDAFNEAIYISRKIKVFYEGGMPYNDIAVLYRRQSQGEVLRDVFEREGIPYSFVYKKSLPYVSFEEEDIEDKVNLLTLHASKGLEFSHVFIVGVNMGNIPLTTKREEEEEEARLFFVGITRAKKHLELSYLTKPNIQGMTQYPSPYISMIPSNLVIREDEVSDTTLADLMKILREEKNKKRQNEKVKKAVHPKYGEGILKYEDENIIKVEFEGYGEKEFSKMFCPVKIIEE